jgi:hypothetical protein
MALSFTGKWMEVKTIMLCKINQTQKDKHHIFSLIFGMQTQKENRHECRRERSLIEKRKGIRKRGMR